jgi:hypothetical protein
LGTLILILKHFKMKRQLNYLPFAIALILLCGCASSSSENVKGFSMTILVSDKLGSSRTDKLPDDIIDLSLTISSTSCPKMVYKPEPVLKRVSDKKIELSLKSEIDGGFAANMSNKKVINRAINRHLQSIQIGVDFSLENDKNIDFQNSIKSFIEAQRKSKIYCFSRSYGDTIFYGQKVFSDLSSLRNAIGQFLCEDPTITSFLIIYNPPEVASQTTTVHFDEIRQANEEAKEDYDKLIQVETELKSYSEEHGNDYRPLYELAKNSIYGKREHHIAFEFLAEAVEIAIENGETQKLKIDIGTDLAKGKSNGIWKLANGHDHDWRPLMEALSDGGSKELRHHND